MVDQTAIDTKISRVNLKSVKKTKTNHETNAVDLSSHENKASMRCLVQAFFVLHRPSRPLQVSWMTHYTHEYRAL